MPPKTKANQKAQQKPPPAPPVEPPPPIVHPNVYQIYERRLKREKAARTAAWLLYSDVQSYVKDAGLADPPSKGKTVEKPDPVFIPPPPKELPPAPSAATPSAVRMTANGSPLMTAEELARKRALIFQFNSKEFELKPEEEDILEGEHLGESDSETGSLSMYLTSLQELQETKEATVAWHKRKAQRKLMISQSKVSKSNLDKQPDGKMKDVINKAASNAMMQSVNPSELGLAKKPNSNINLSATALQK